jgi:hypothetical protein
LFIGTLLLFRVDDLIFFVKQIETGGATRILVDKVINNRDGSPALLVQGTDYYHITLVSFT